MPACNTASQSCLGLHARRNENHAITSSFVRRPKACVAIEKDSAKMRSEREFVPVPETSCSHAHTECLYPAQAASLQPIRSALLLCRSCAPPSVLLGGLHSFSDSIRPCTTSLSQREDPAMPQQASTSVCYGIIPVCLACSSRIGQNASAGTAAVVNSRFDIWQLPIRSYCDNRRYAKISTSPTGV